MVADQHHVATTNSILYFYLTSNLVATNISISFKQQASSKVVWGRMKILIPPLLSLFDHINYYHINAEKPIVPRFTKIKSKNKTRN